MLASFLKIVLMGRFGGDASNERAFLLNRCRKDGLKSLLERDWVKVVGHRDVPGKPAMYATTRGFLDYFNLKALDQLPPLADVKDLETMTSALPLE